MSDLEYSAFISYSHADAQTAAWLHRALERYKVPRRLVDALKLDRSNIGRVFRDFDELGTATSLTAKIQEALDASATLVVICSPNARVSPWVRKEIAYFRSRHPERSVLPLIAQGTPDEAMPDELKFRIAPDGSLTGVADEALGVALTTGRKTALLRIVAGLLGVSFDDLRRREQQRRQRRLVGVTAASLTAAAFSIGLAIFALEQQRRAEQEAAVAKQVTEFLTDLFKASDPFAERNADVSVRDVLVRGTENLEQRDGLDTRVRMRLLGTIGDVYTQLGLYEQARAHLEAAWSLHQVDPGATDPAEALDLQTARAWIATETGDSELAVEIYRSLLPPLSDVASYASDLPQTSDWARLVNDYGVLLRDMAAYGDARAVLEQAVALSQAASGPVHGDVAVTFNNLGLVLLDSGDYEGAKRQLERSLEISTEVWGPDHPNHIYTLQNLASTVRRLGDFDAAIEYLERGIAIAERHFPEEHRSTVGLYNGLGIVRLAQGRLAEAREQLEYAGRLAVAVFGDGHSMVVSNLQHQARVANAMGDLQNARELYEKTATVSGGYGPGVASELASILEQLGDFTGAEELHRYALHGVVEQYGADSPLEARYQARLADFLARKSGSNPPTQRAKLSRE